MRRLKFSKAQLQKLGIPKIGEDPFSNLISGKKKIREKGMNKTEQAFSKVLEDARKSGQILRWEFEAVSLRIGPGTRYTPDFLAVLPDGHWQFFETKGHLRDDAAVKFKAASDRYPECSFMMLRRKKGGWEPLYNIIRRGKANLDPCKA